MDIKIADIFCGYCSPNVKKEDFDSYTSDLENIIWRSRRRFPAMVVADDINAKTTGGGSIKANRRGTCLLDILTKNEIVAIRVPKDIHFI
jgi:hypothetical protein